MPCRYFFWLSYTTFALFRAPVLLQKLVEVDFFLHFVLQRLYVSIYIVKWVIFSDMHGFTSSWLLTFRSKMAKRKAMPTLCPFRGQYQVSLENTHCQFAKIFEELPQCKVHSFLKLLFKSIFTKNNIHEQILTVFEGNIDHIGSHETKYWPPHRVRQYI